MKLDGQTPSTRGANASTALQGADMANPSVAQQKLIQYLNEAYGLEQRLESALEAHIGMASYEPYKKRLREHLTETRRHGREVGKRIKQLGGEASTIDPPGPSAVGDAAQAVIGGAQKAVAFVQGPLHALRGTSDAERQLKNAKSEYSDEAEEIATYSAIEALAAALSDRNTQQLARAIRREEERMRSYLEKEIPRFTRGVVKAEIPASQRAKATRSRAKARRPGAKAKTAGAPASTRAKASAARGGSGPRAKATGKAGARSTAARPRRRTTTNPSAPARAGAATA
jgi:ferritin-like metal-binding protein YciE